MSRITLSAYGIALAACFICNLAIEGRLSWFYIVLTSLLLAASLFPLPLLLKRGRIPATLVSSTALIGLTRLNPWLKGAFAAMAAAFLSAVVNPMAGYLFGYESQSLRELLTPGSWSPDSISNKIVFYCLLFVAACCILVRVFFSGRNKQK